MLEKNTTTQTSWFSDEPEAFVKISLLNGESFTLKASSQCIVVRGKGLVTSLELEVEDVVEEIHWKNEI